MSDCVFCAIVAGRLPAFLVADEPAGLAFLDTRPVFPGHTLVIPRPHIATLADLPESSKRFLGGVVSYTADKKMELLGIPEAVISKDGVVSQATARLMAEGARRLLGAGLAISITGVAGPEEQDGKPVGLTYIGVSVDGKTQVREYHWPGGRATNRVASVEAAIELAADVLSSASG